MENNIYLDLNRSFDDNIQMETEEAIMEKEEMITNDNPQEMVRIKKSMCQRILNLLKSATIGKK